MKIRLGKVPCLSPLSVVTLLTVPALPAQAATDDASFNTYVKQLQVGFDIREWTDTGRSSASTTITLF